MQHPFRKVVEFHPRGLELKAAAIQGLTRVRLSHGMAPLLSKPWVRKQVIGSEL